MTNTFARAALEDFPSKAGINRVAAGAKLKQYIKNPLSLVLMIFVILSAVFAMGVLLFIIGYILINGIPNITAEQFEWKYTPENQSMTPAIINTLIITVLTLLAAVPIGIFAAVYLAEYSKKGSKPVKAIRLAIETLSGIPSIVFGLFGYIVFYLKLKWDYSILSGVITLAIMILPLIIRTSEEALSAVPDSCREGSFGLGAGKVRTVFTVILPSAFPGIMSGIILAIGRIVGESAALIFTSGTANSLPESMTGAGSSAATLTVHMYIQSNEGLHTNQAFASAVILLVLTFLINLASDAIERSIAKKRG